MTLTNDELAEAIKVAHEMLRTQAFVQDSYQLYKRHLDELLAAQRARAIRAALAALEQEEKT